MTGFPAFPLVTPLRRIATAKGDVLHGMKASDPGFVGFGEAYFSEVEAGAIKGWKRHREMTLNLICPVGAVRVVVHDGSDDVAQRLDLVLSPAQAATYRRLTVPAGSWVAFQGVAPGISMLLNLASQMHDPAEAETVPLETYTWPESD